MNQKSAPQPSGISPKTDRVVGREQELKLLKDYLYARGDSNIVYYHGDGGLGKTRLLEELQVMVEDAGPGYHSCGIIDLYHTDTHSNSDVERAIVEGLDPEEKYFSSYREARAYFELLRERGTDPHVLERHRRELSKQFIEGCKDMALVVRKLVICFDTVELLQYESSVVEIEAGLDSVDTRLKPWLLINLPKMNNVLIVIAGRPIVTPPGEDIDLQARFINDIKTTFGENLSIRPLPPFQKDETASLIAELSGGSEVIPENYIPVVHKLTEGRPIFIHLIVDLIKTLSLEPRKILSLFDQYQELVDDPEDSPKLIAARKKIENEILYALIYQTGDIGEYLRHIALMPKGINADILQASLGIPLDDANHLIDTIRPLSFTKEYYSLPGGELLHVERLFLHDEMYRLLSSKDFTPTIQVTARTIANTLLKNFYNSQITQIEEALAEQTPESRIDLRERLQKIQVENLYYLLVQNPLEGYQKYKELSEQANRNRWVGFSVRLLDEFLRFYNDPQGRERISSAGISNEQVIRESAELWVERFYEWRHRARTVEFAERILAEPEKFFIDPVEHLPIFCNICSLWGYTRAVLHGYETDIVKKAQSLLDQLPVLADCDPEQARARGRLSNMIGYQLRLGGNLGEATEKYVAAQAAFRSLDDRVSLSSVLRNLSFAYSIQGKMPQARALANEALSICTHLKDEYSIGLSFSALARIAAVRGNYPQAIKYGARSLEVFEEMDDAHGKSRARLAIVLAKRRQAKHEMEKELAFAEAEELINEARKTVEAAILDAENADLRADLHALKVERGRVYRELGHFAQRTGNREDSFRHYRESDQIFGEITSSEEMSLVEKADLLQDWAEVLFFLRDEDAACQKLDQIEELLGEEFTIVPGKRLPDENLPSEYFSPLGKAELLRGQIDFSNDNPRDGLEHFIIAHAYFVLFSRDALEKDMMVGYLYNHIKGLPTKRKAELMALARKYIQQNKLEAFASSFVDTLEDLLGQ